MICSNCHGEGYFESYFPCPECNGSGIASCCDAAGSREVNMEILIVMRLVDMVNVHPDQDNSRVCSQCKEQVGIYPSGQGYLQQNPKLVIMCSRCGNVNEPVAPPTEEIVREMLASVRRTT